MEVKLQSKEGFPYQTIAITVIILIVIVVLISLGYNLYRASFNTLDWKLYFLPAIVVVQCLFVLLLFPNTFLVKLKNGQIEIISGRARDIIPLSYINNISESASFGSSWNYHIQFYRLDFSTSTKFGKTIYFRCSSQDLTSSSKNFGEILKSEWLKEVKR